MTQELCSTSNAYMLQLAGVNIGTFCFGFTCNSQLATAVKVRHNFYSLNTYADGHYPAVDNQFVFTMYHEKADREAFAGFFMNLSLLYFNTYQDLKLLRIHDGSVAIDFGICLMNEPPKLKTPDELLMAAAGIFTLGFLNTSLPTVF